MARTTSDRTRVSGSRVERLRAGTAHWPVREASDGTRSCGFQAGSVAGWCGWTSSETHEVPARCRGSAKSCSCGLGPSAGSRTTCRCISFEPGRGQAGECHRTIRSRRPSTGSCELSSAWRSQRQCPFEPQDAVSEIPALFPADTCNAVRAKVPIVDRRDLCHSGCADRGGRALTMDRPRMSVQRHLCQVRTTSGRWSGQTPISEFVTRSRSGGAGLGEQPHNLTSF